MVFDQCGTARKSVGQRYEEEPPTILTVSR